MPSAVAQPAFPFLLLHRALPVVGSSRVVFAGKAPRVLCCRGPGGVWKNELKRRGFEPFHKK